MKRITMWLLMAAMVISVMGTSAVEAGSFDDITVFVDGEQVIFDTKPIIRDSRTLVPVRGVFEKLGATVDWNSQTNQVIVKDDIMELLLQIGNDAVLVDGEVNFLDTRSMIIDDRTMVPLRFIAETLGYKVSWNGVTHRIDIETQELVKDTDKGLPTVGSSKGLYELLGYSHNLNHYIQSRFMFEDVMPIEVDVDFDRAEILEDSIAVDNSQSEPAMEESVESKASEDFSGTNNQVDGVEEGDIIKTDGEFIYYSKDNGVIILDSDPVNPSVVGNIKVDTSRGYLNNIYVGDDKLTVLGTSYVYYAYPIEIMEDAEIGVVSKSIAPFYNTANTFVVTYDISEPDKPEILLDLDFEGTLTTSRMIGDKLYLVTNKSVDYYSLERTNDPKLDYQILPKYSDNVKGQVTSLDYDEIYYFPDYIQPNFLTTAGVDLSTGDVDLDSYLGRAENVYASLENMYLTFTNYEYTNTGTGLLYVPDYKINTSIYKFGLNDGGIEYKSEGKVDGTVVNQFSLDEHDGNLRIATTSGEMWNPDNISKNNVYILDSELKPLGQVTGLAEGERIYSTRFAGDRIYMVTFRQVDPFFVIDASDPASPQVLGQLKIPGFSTYMHILDENHVLGFGKDTVEDGDFVRQGGFKISLFDVTDPTAPVEKKQEVIGTAGTYSELDYNHKALMISLSKGIMGFPISVASETPYSTDFIGAYVYDLAMDDFSFKGTITHSDSLIKYDYTNQIQRLLYIGDSLYTLSNGKMKVTSLIDMETTGEVEF